MANIDCRHKIKSGIRYKCSKAKPDQDRWNGIAKDLICKTCKAPELEAIHDCRYFDIAIIKEFSDKPDVIVNRYCLLHSSTKQSRNEIKDLSECGTNKSPDKCKHKAYKPSIQEGMPIPKPTDKRIVNNNIAAWIFLPAMFIYGLGVLWSILIILQMYDGVGTNNLWYIGSGTDLRITIPVGIFLIIFALMIAYTAHFLNRDGKQWVFSIYCSLIILVGLGCAGISYVMIEYGELPQVIIPLIGAIISIFFIFWKLPGIKIIKDF